MRRDFEAAERIDAVNPRPLAGPGRPRWIARRAAASQDLGSLLESLVLVDRDDRNNRTAASRDYHVLEPNHYLVRQIGELGPHTFPAVAMSQPWAAAL